MPYFNPRAPRGARQGWGYDRIVRLCISIHAPLAGRDFDYYWPVFANIGISIHAPLAGRDGNINQIWQSLNGFQSTRPSRGATDEY